MLGWIVVGIWKLQVLISFFNIFSSYFLILRDMAVAASFLSLSNQKWVWPQLKHPHASLQCISTSFQSLVSLGPSKTKTEKWNQKYKTNCPSIFCFGTKHPEMSLSLFQTSLQQCQSIRNKLQRYKRDQPVFPLWYEEYLYVAYYASQLLHVVERLKILKKQKCGTTMKGKVARHFSMLATFVRNCILLWWRVACLIMIIIIIVVIVIIVIVIITIMFIIMVNVMILLVVSDGPISGANRAVFVRGQCPVGRFLSPTFSLFNFSKFFHRTFFGAVISLSSPTLEGTKLTLLNLTVEKYETGETV